MKKYNVTVNGSLYQVEIEEVDSFGAVPAPAAAPAPAPAPAATPAPAPAPKAAPVPAASGSAGANVIKAPMAGTIVSVNVKVGDTIADGSVVAVLEAMKMENEIFAPASGTVASVNVNKGANVSADDILITFN